MIKFEDITTECFKSVTFEIKEGSVCKIILDSDYDKEILLDTIFTFKKPIGGDVLLLDRNIYTISEKELFKIFNNIGVVLKDGGLISNLKVWENITLPVWYNTGKIPEGMEEVIIDIFKKMGRNTDYISVIMGKLSGSLPVNEKKLIGLVRAMTKNPKLMIYDSIFEGQSHEMLKKLVMLTTKFHSEDINRTSVYISTDEIYLKDVKADVILKQCGRGFNIWN